MPFMIPPDARIQPLTRELFRPFGKTRHIDGRIEDITRGIDRYIGSCLVAAGGDDVFSHPVLFKDPYFASRTWGWVRITYDPAADALVMRPCRQGGEPSGEETATAPPATTAEIPLDAVLEYMKTIESQGKCINPACQGARDRPLQLARTVFYVDASRRMVVACRKCFRETQAKDAAGIFKVILEGSQLPPHAPVIIFADPVPSAR